MTEVINSSEGAPLARKGRNGKENRAIDGYSTFKRPSITGWSKGRTWDDFFTALVAYKDRNGHTNCPYYYEKDRALGDWVNRQRKMPALLDPVQIDQLNSIGFDWSTTQERLWNEKYAELLAFFDKFGHSKVPKTYDDSLCNWVAKQRQIHGQGRLQPDRVEKLEHVKFLWRVKQHTARTSAKEEEKWKAKYTRLVAYKEKFGTTA